jgi:hypothetical protein
VREVSPLTVDFLVRVHSFLESVSAVEQEKREKAERDPEYRAEDGEPKGNVPAWASEECDFARQYFWKSCHEVDPSMMRFSY